MRLRPVWVTYRDPVSLVKKGWDSSVYTIGLVYKRPLIQSQHWGKRRVCP